MLSRSVIRLATARSVTRATGLLFAKVASPLSTTACLRVEKEREVDYYDDYGVHARGDILPRPRDKAPDFKGKAVVNKQFKDIQLSDYKGKWLILFFYPLDFTFVCPTEITAFSDRADEFKAINCELITCSTDSHFSHLGWINMPRKQGGLGDMKIPVLSDFSKQISKDYGVLLNDLGAALRGLFIIDPNGIVKHVCVNDLTVGRSVDEALRILQAFQFVEKHGEVCPANWKPNSPTIKPTAEGSKSYFEKAGK